MSANTWIALKVPKCAALDLAVVGGERPERMHLTLAFLGRYLSAAQVDDVRAAVAAWARATPPLSGRIHGIGRFDGETLDTVWVGVLMPGLRAAREALVDGLPVPLATEHAWMPHITLAFVPKDVPFIDAVPRVPIAFDTVGVWSGDKSWSYKLRGKQ